MQSANEFDVLTEGNGNDLRGSGPFDFAVSNAPDTDPTPWAAAGATWCLTGFGPSPRLATVRAAIAAGP